MLINIQWTDASATVINAYFSAPQDPEFYPFQQQIDTSDPRWHAYFDAMTPFTQAALPSPT